MQNVSFLQQKLLEKLRSRRQSMLRLKNRYDWAKLARCTQKEPAGDWRVWLILAGRGFGKTRTGSETVRAWIKTGRVRRLCLLAQTLDEARAVMVEGNSGLLAVHPPDERPTFQAAKARLVWPCGAMAQIFSASCYEKLRGPQFDGAWVDELAKFPYAQEAWDQLMMGMRLGERPRVIITTTPRPIPLVKALLKRDDVHVTRGTTFDNAQNLSSPFLDQMKERYTSSALGRQEIFGEMVESEGAALWSPALLEKAKENFHKWYDKKGKDIYGKCVIAIDPAVTSHHKSDETGIIVARQHVNADGDVQGVCVLEDASMKGEPIEWMQRAVALYHHHQADCIVAEVNNGGDLIGQLLQTVDANVTYRPVRAKSCKWTRAEPAAALYRAGKVAHASALETLEAQMCAYVPAASRNSAHASPDRLDALVWALFALYLETSAYTPVCPPQIWHL